MPRPQIAGVRCAERFVGWAGPVVGSVLVHDKQFPLVGDRVIEPAEGSSNTLLGFETTSPCPLVSGWGAPGLRFGGLGCRPTLVVGCGV